MKALLLSLLIIFSFQVSANNFPPEWWMEVPQTEAESWEILPQAAKAGEVILSKRTELGIFSNFAATPFELDGESFASVEGLWQSLKYPDPDRDEDPRNLILEWPFTREEVRKMSGHEAKRAGNLAKKIYEKNQLKNVSWQKHFFDYRDHAEGSEFHYQLIRRALVAKLKATEGLWDLLMRTDCLILKPDHYTSDKDPASYRYYDIFMDIRRERQFVPCEIFQSP